MEFSDSQYDDILTDVDDDGFEYGVDLFDSPSATQTQFQLESQENLLSEPNASEAVNNEFDADDENSNNGSDVDIEMEMSTEPECRSLEAANRIEDMVLSFLTQLVNIEGNSECATKSEAYEQTAKRQRKKGKRSNIELRLVDRKKTVNLNDPKFRYIKFPTKAERGSARTLAQLFRVLDLAHEAVLNNVPVTKRDMYYRDVPLFKSQKAVDTLVDDIAATFQLERSDLNIRATSKGLISGSGFTIHLISGECIQTMNTEGTLIPVGEDVRSFSIDEDISWVLVVEKEAVFQTLIQMKVVDHPLMPGRGLLITGKGYPDIATRHLVKSLTDALPRTIPIMVLVDADPYGLDILRIKWLGLWSSELESFCIDKTSLIPITKQDEKKALAMLRRPSLTFPNSWKKELQHMLYARRKAEIEILSSATGNSSALDVTTSGWKQSCSPDIRSPPEPRHDGTSTPCSTSASSQESDRRYTGFEHSSHRTPRGYVSPEPRPAPLLRYLSTKSAMLISSARARADATI
ncbi:Spo11/DNA topoisomerase VI subunit A [Cyathus striatus]|nr:Spo11/DNA topoisomerase VI subunit A [Cyathus striatus]